MSLDGQGRANRRRRPAELALPERMAQHDPRRRAPAHVVRLGEHAAGRGPDAEHAEEAPADPQAVFGEARLPRRREIERRVSPRQHAGERLLIRAHGLPQRIRDVRVPSGVVPRRPSTVRNLDDGQVPRLRNRQRPNAQRVDQLEDRGVGADAEGEREHGDGGESGTAQQDAGAVPEILSEVLDDADAPGIAALLFALLDAVHRPERREPRVGGGEAFRDELIGQPLDVKPELVVELPLDGVSAEQGADAEGYGVEPAFKAHGDRS